MTSANSAATSAASAASAIQATIFDAKGDLIAASAADTAARLAAASTAGYLLAVNSATATGLEWVAPNVGDITEVQAGTGISVTSGTGPIPSVAIDSTVATTSGTQTFTNKTISVDNNTISGIVATSFVLSDASGNIDGAAGQKVIPSGTVVGTSDTQTLTNKTLTTPVISTISNTGTITLPTATDTLVGRATTDTLTNKTLTSPTITTPTQRLTLNAQTGTTYTLVAADATYKLVTASNTAAITITVPPSVFTVGDVINVQQIGAGQVTFSQGSGVTITSTGATTASPKTRVQYSAAAIICTTTSTGFTILGDIA